ncbi:WD repeat-containing protein 75-like [Macrobrachium nipponense]|uniref:WD repeat-containing protein 75-like n=1 Tax=Macrobrachium nipponense TaxID=159736 RepID=UPI0030C84CA1
MAKDSSVDYYWGPLIQCKPIVTSSSKFLVVALGSALRIFSTSSGSLLRILRGHNHEVVGFALLDDAEDNFISCDESGKLCRWSLQVDVKRSPLVQTCNLLEQYTKNKCKVVNFVSSGNLKAVVFGVLEEDKDLEKLIVYTSKSGSKMKGLRRSYLKSSVKLGHGKIALSPNGDFVVWLKKQELRVKSLVSADYRRHFVGVREITCMACHPSKLSVATGDCTGRVLLWYQLYKQPVKTELHWHSLPVSDLAFSRTGAELYSGGAECVLVKWQITEGKKHFLPRLGMPIKYVVTDTKNNKIVCAHIDSAFTVISARDCRLEGSIQGLSLSIDDADPYPAGIVYDPRTRAIVINGKSGHLQFYDLSHNKLLYQLDIVRENFINPERDVKMYNTEVKKVAISPEGTWLATVECRDDFQSSIEIRLKFWQFDSEKQSWFLNTGIELPHDKYVNGLVFDPSSESSSTAVCASCSDDGKFKIWEVFDSSDIYKQSFTWSCQKTGIYRHLPAKAVTIAPDGSLVAAGFANILTIWTPDQCHLKGTLSQPYLKENLLQIEFGRTASCGSMVITRSESWLCGWNLFTCTLSWRVMINSTCMAVDPVTSFVVVFSNKCDAFMFEPRNMQMPTRLENIITSPALCAAFIPREKKVTLSTPWNEESQLFIIDKAQRLKLIEPKGDIHAAEAAIEGLVQKLVQDTVALPAPTPFSSLLAQTRASDVVDRKTSQVGSAAYGVRVQNSSALLAKVLNEARVYRLDDFATLAREYFQLIIPEAVTSKEKMDYEDFETYYKKIGGNPEKKTGEKSDSEMTEKEAKKTEKKNKKKLIERGLNSDFKDLLQIIADD